MAFHILSTHHPQRDACYCACPSLGVADTPCTGFCTLELGMIKYSDDASGDMLYTLYLGAACLVLAVRLNNWVAPLEVG